MAILEMHERKVWKGRVSTEPSGLLPCGTSEGDRALPLVESGAVVPVRIAVGTITIMSAEHTESRYC